MEKFKVKPKVVLIIVLAIITIAGIVLYLSTDKKTDSTIGQADNKSFLSFFGERKLKKVDETVVPGATAGGSGSGTALGGTDTSTGSGLDTGAGTAGVNNIGNLSLMPIGNNGSLGTNTAGQTGVGTAGGVGTNTGAGTGTGLTTGTGAGSTTGGTGSTTQIDCTPPQLPYTDAEIAELKELTQRFYRIAANLHTDVDVENERLTRKSYYDLYNQTLDYTKQCYAELRDPKYADKAKNANAEWHPYLTETVLKRISTYDPRVQFIVNSAEATLNKEINIISTRISKINTQIAFLQSLGTATNDAQKNLLSTLATELDAETKNLNAKKSELLALRTTPGGISKDIVGTFFTEDKYKLLNLRQPRQNKNARIDKIWLYAGTFIKDSGRSTNTTNDLFTPGSSLFGVNPLKSLILDQWDETLNDAPRYQPGNLPQSYMHIFRMLEDGLRIW